MDGIQARSAGTRTGARIKVTAGHLGWADRVFVMEKKHLRRLERKVYRRVGQQTRDLPEHPG
jgi:predicted protein tyrosine phosphatase